MVFMVIRISRDKVIYSFSSKHIPAAYADIGDIVVFETIDALGNQIRGEDTRLEELDWNRVNPATGPLYVRGAMPGDTLVVDILDVRVDEKAIILVVPGFGILGDKGFSSRVKILWREGSFIRFDSMRIKLKPMIGVIGVAPREGEIATGDLGEHGGNMDISILGKGTRVYLPVFVEGALLAIGDLHMVQGDGELCISATETSGEVIVRVNVIKGRRPRYPVLETDEYYSILAYGKTLDEAAYRASEEAVKALMNAHNLGFEEAYMLSSLVVNLKINQVVDPHKGIRAEIPKEYISIDNLLIKNKKLTIGTPPIRIIINKLKPH